MLEEAFKPYDQQFDSGFSSTGCSFFEAAKSLEENSSAYGFGLGGSRLPIFYLYRHSCELFFKSILIILHRRFECEIPSKSNRSFPEVIIDSRKPKQLFSVHSIKELFDSYQSRIKALAPEIQKISALTDWVEIPKEISGLVDVVEKADAKSSMFRYPVTLDTNLDSQKSSIKEISPDVISKHLDHKKGGRGRMIMALKDSDGAFVKAYTHDETAMDGTLLAIKQLSEMMHGASIGMMMEIGK